MTFLWAFCLVLLGVARVAGVQPSDDVWKVRANSKAQAALHTASLADLDIDNDVDNVKKIFKNWKLEMGKSYKTEAEVRRFAMVSS